MLHLTIHEAPYTRNPNISANKIQIVDIKKKIHTDFVTCIPGLKVFIASFT